MSKYVVHNGQFPCHTCKVVVPTLRHYIEDGKLTWMCPSKHMSSVSLRTKKSKKDYERENRE